MNQLNPYMRLPLLACLAPLALLPARSSAQDGTQEPLDTIGLQAEMQEQLARMDSLERSYNYQSGTIALENGIATLEVPENFKFLGKDQARQVIVEVWGNPPGSAEGVLGIIMPAADGVLGEGFTFIVEYDPMGYVSDEDADDIDYDDLMKELLSDNAESNRQRVESGYARLDLVGWAAPPYYDKENKVLHWAKELRPEESEENTLNYNVRVLGRKGVLILNAVSGMSALEEVKANIPAVLKMARFNPGYTYEEFDSNIDEVAAWTVGGLVAGKVLAKAGILALILKNIKLVIVALAAAGGAAWKFMTGRRNKENQA